MSSTCVFDLSLTAFACLHQSLSVFTILDLWLYLCPYLCLYLFLPALPAFKTFYLPAFTRLHLPLPGSNCVYHHSWGSSAHRVLCVCIVLQ